MRSLGLLILLTVLTSIIVVSDYTPIPGYYYYYTINSATYYIRIINETSYSTQPPFATITEPTIRPFRIQGFAFSKCRCNCSIVYIPSILLPLTGLVKASNLTLYEAINLYMNMYKSDETEDCSIINYENVATLLGASVIYSPLYSIIVKEALTYNYTETELTKLIEIKQYSKGESTHMIKMVMDIEFNDIATNTTYHQIKSITFSKDTGHILHERVKLYINDTLGVDTETILSDTNDPNLEFWISSSETVTLTPIITTPTNTPTTTPTSTPTSQTTRTCGKIEPPTEKLVVPIILEIILLSIPVAIYIIWEKRRYINQNSNKQVQGKNNAR